MNFCKFLFAFCLLPFALYCLLFVSSVSAGSLLHVSDTISTPRRNVLANHTIRFTPVTTIPPSGKIVITPEVNDFEIISSLDYTDVDLSVDETDFFLAAAPGSGAQSPLGVAVTPGKQGSIIITLNDNDSIVGGSQVIIEIGSQATYGYLGHKSIVNPLLVGSYKIHIETQNALSRVLERADAMVAVVEQVTVGGAAIAICGNGVVTGDEECDDGNTVSGDSCSATCQIEIPPVIPPTAPPAAPANETGTVTVEPELGGSTTQINVDESSAKVFFPQEAVEEPVIVKVRYISKSAIVSFYSTPPGLKIVGDWIYSCTVKTTDKKLAPTLLKPATLTFKYTDSQVSGFDETTLKLYRGLSSTYKWVVVPTSEVNPDTNTITATVTHFTTSLFAIMGSPILVIPKERPVDLNTDKKVDLVDFSILLYNWGKPKNPKADINNDGVVDLVDFSIMLYWWTG